MKYLYKGEPRGQLHLDTGHAGANMRRKRQRAGENRRTDV